jgi:hypothetical protein
MMDAPPKMVVGTTAAPHRLNYRVGNDDAVH